MHGSLPLHGGCGGRAPGDRQRTPARRLRHLDDSHAPTLPRCPSARLGPREGGEPSADGTERVVRSDLRPDSLYSCDSHGGEAPILRSLAVLRSEGPVRVPGGAVQCQRQPRDELLGGPCGIGTPLSAYLLRARHKIVARRMDVNMSGFPRSRRDLPGVRYASENRNNLTNDSPGRSSPGADDNHMNAK